MELDSCTSSDALLMNIFCHPGVKRDGRLAARLGAEPGTSPRFGYKARVPLANGRFDRTEVDLRLADLLVEAKLTESDFQSAEKGVLWAYRDFSDVFDWEQLPQTDDRYRSYQLNHLTTAPTVGPVAAGWAAKDCAIGGRLPKRPRRCGGWKSSSSKPRRRFSLNSLP